MPTDFDMIRNVGDALPILSRYLHSLARAFACQAGATASRAQPIHEDISNGEQRIRRLCIADRHR